MYKGPNRREHKRIEKPFIVRFRIRTRDELVHGQLGWNMVAVLNLGAGGTLFYYTSKIEVGSMLDMKINVEVSESPIICEAEAIRVEELKHSYMYLVAVKFKGINDREKVLINRAAEELHTQVPVSAESFED